MNHVDETASYASQDEAIVAALDCMEEGDTLVVHESHCQKSTTDQCTCNPQSWTY